MRKILFIIFTTIVTLSFLGCKQNDNEVLDRTDETSGKIYVLGELIEAPPPGVDGNNGVIMLPLFPIAEHLGLEVSWNQKEEKICVNNICIWIGKAQYVRNGENPVEFGPAPDIFTVGDEKFVYVPIHFFEYALGGYKALIIDKDIYIEIIQ